jgi:hypothetical protein
LIEPFQIVRIKGQRSVEGPSLFALCLDFPSA